MISITNKYTFSVNEMKITLKNQTIKKQSNIKYIKFGLIQVKQNI